MSNILLNCQTNISQTQINIRISNDYSKYPKNNLNIFLKIMSPPENAKHTRRNSIPGKLRVFLSN